MENMDLLKLIQQGWIATYPLILFSVLTVAILAERMFALRNTVSSIETVTSLLLPYLTGGDFNSAISISDKYKNSFSAKIYHPVLARAKNKTFDEVSVQLDEKRFEEIHNLRQNIWVLGTIASSAPFIGLLGTVIGIIKSFHSMSVMGTGGFSVVAGGISEALVATAAGLLVAIVAVIAYNYLQTKIANVNTEMKINSAKFLEAYREGKRINGNREV